MIQSNSMFGQLCDGDITQTDYNNWRAKCAGYDDHRDYCRKQSYKTGKHKPLSEVKDCGAYLGVYIAEQVLSNIFENVQRMPYGNRGYDFICQGGYKIDVKCACLSDCTWSFHIGKNCDCDYFLLLAFDNRIKLNPQHLLLIKSTEPEDNPISNRTAVHVYENSRKWFKYEQINKLDQLVTVCKEVNNGIN